MYPTDEGWGALLFLHGSECTNLHETHFESSPPLMFSPEWRSRGRRRRQKVQKTSAPRAPLHPAAQTQPIHRASRLLHHHALPEPPALTRPPRRQPPQHAPVHASAHPQPRPRRLRPLLRHLPVLRRRCHRRQPRPASSRHPQVSDAQPVAFQ